MVNKTINVVKVGIGDYKIVGAPHLLRTVGLGSCMGVVLYDPALKLAGMAHILLPDSSQSRQGAFNRLKYADTAISDMIQAILLEGGRKYALKAKIAGGSQMFSTNSGTSSLKIGERNTAAVLENLARHRIPVLAQDTGGSAGRTIEFCAETGVLKIRTVHAGEAKL